MSQDIQDLIKAHFCIREEKADHHFRTELPNIIFDLGLDSYEFQLYAFIKKIAGDSGGCWKSNPNISKDIGISERKIQNALKILASPFKLLGNKPLITIIERKKDNRSPDSNLIVITNIWRINGDHGRKQDVGGGASDAGGVVHDVRGGGACGAPKEEPYNKISKEEVACMASPDFIKIFDLQGNERQILKQDLYFIAEKFKLNWSTEEVLYLYEKLAKNTKPVVELTKFCKAIVEKKREVERAEKYANKKKETNKNVISPNTPPYNGGKATRNFMDVLNEKLKEKKNGL